MGQHRTIQGETWDSISFKQYGNEKLFPLLMQSNPEHIHTVIFDAGVLMLIPEQPDEVPDDLPPWKRDDAI